MKHLLSIFSFSVILAHPHLRKVWICRTYHTITQKRLLLKLPTGIPVYSQENRRRAGSNAHRPQKTANKSFWQAAVQRFENMQSAPRVVIALHALHTRKASAHRAKKQQHHQIANRATQPSGAATPRDSDAHKRIAVPKALCVLRECPGQDPKTAKFAALPPGHAGFPKRAERSEGSDTTPIRNAPCFGV